MGAGHGHGHGHGHTAGAANRGRLALVLALMLGVAVVQVAGAAFSGSLALLADAGHTVTDSFGVALALVAVWIAARPARGRSTFGHQRAEILAAAVNALVLFVLCAFIVVEAVERLRSPAEVSGPGMVVVAAVGLVANIAGALVLRSGAKESLNVKGAYLEVWADMIGSLGVVAGALVIHFTGWRLADPLIAAAIGLWVLPRAWVLVRQAGNVLMMGVPEGIDLEQVRGALAGLPGVEDVHDLHVWALASRQAAMTAHLVVDEAVDARALRHAAGELLHGRFGIGHATLQVETGPCHGPDCGAGHAGGHAWRPGPRGDRG